MRQAPQLCEPKFAQGATIGAQTSVRWKQCLPPMPRRVVDPSMDRDALYPDELAELCQQWESDLRDAPLLSANYFRDIVSSYNEPHRHYHDANHVIAVVKRVTALAALSIGNTADVRIAAWYHDVIYDPMSATNEADSAERAIEELTCLHLEPNRIERIAALVNMTKHHQPATTNEAVLADADLWTLGGSTADYFTYGALIRKEYAHVSDDDWRTGRSGFIETFLTRPHIFHTETGRNQREVQARENLAAELNTLTRFA
jgi:predicted metal-dependent HD superfamily phosphohydrolase